MPNDTYAQIIPAELRTLDEPSLSNALFQLGLKYVIDDPIRYVLLSLSRLFVYFTFWPSPNSGLLSNVTRVTSLGVALPFVLYGLFLSFKQWRSWSLLYVFIVVYVGIHISTWALVRYRLPVDAVLLVFAAYGLANLFYRLRQHRDRKHSSRTLHIGQNLRQSI
ncbi:MAG: hypothetical protein HC853_14010 [Anaerolineae bacterium]|nr:hypothetical protein [Anaerolineae bacterium]